QNIWMRVRHIASDPNGTGIGFNVPETQGSPFRSGGFGGWWGFLYQFDIYKDENLVGCRSNTLNGLYPVNIIMENIETLSQPEWLMFENLNVESSDWILNSINFTGNNPGSNPGFSGINIPYPDPFPGGFSSTFPAASKNIYAIDLGGTSYAEFKMSANNVSQFKYGYEYNSSGGYQGIRLSFGTALVLPLNLLRFDAFKNKTNVQLSWKTTNEINTSYFMLQRSTNGTTFNNIGKVEAVNTSGNNEYSFTDESPVNGINYYRLQMVDIDGKTTYSFIIKIVFGNTSELQVFPNPAKNIITVNGLQSKGTLKIIATDGKLIKQITITGISLQIDMSKLAKGMYILQYYNEVKTDQVKIIKQ
ncbi:MAG: T9SS type A sorting domain-containing protein, partial [Chitinophagaceae bacterium]